MKQITIQLAGRNFTIDEPVFCVLKKLLPVFNRLQAAHDNSARTFDDLNLILILLLGKQSKKLGWFRRPSVAELANLLQKLPGFLGLEPDDHASGGRKRGSEAESWDELYCIIIDRTGWTWEQIDNTMTLSRLAALNEYWQEHPPTNNLVAAYLGYKYEPADGGIADLIRQLKMANNDE